MSVAALFGVFVACHIATGALGLVAFWIPVAGRKGGRAHRRGGRVFIWTMLLTGGFAIGISLCTLAAPVATHPHLLSHDAFDDPEDIRNIFGWMMLYLAALTVNLAWYGRQCLRHRIRREAAREWRNLGLQALLLLLSMNCLMRGALAGQLLMVGISFVGVATVATNMWHLYGPRPARLAWLREHVKALVGAGISVYTAFFAFGAVRILPEAALTPALWSAPLIVGLGLILYHRRAIRLRAGRGQSFA